MSVVFCTENSMPRYTAFIEIPWSPGSQREAGQAKNAPFDNTSPARVRHWRDVEPAHICIQWSPESQGEAGQAKQRTKLNGWDAEAEEEDEMEEEEEDKQEEEESLPVLEASEDEDEDEHLHQHQINYVDDEMQEVEMQESLLHHSTTRCKNHSSTSYLSSPKAQRVLEYPVCPPPEVQGIEPTQRAKRKLFSIQSRGILGKFIPLPEHREKNATRVIDKKRAKRACSAEPSFQQQNQGRRRSARVPAEQSQHARTRTARAASEVHVHERHHQHISVRRKVTLRHVYTKESTILDATGKPAGKGLFAGSSMKRGDYASEYGGLVVWNSKEFIAEMAKLGHLSHTRCLGSTGAGQCGKAIDSRVHGKVFTDEYYAQNHMMGGYANDPAGSGRPANCEYFATWVTKPFTHPYLKDANYIDESKRRLESNPEIPVVMDRIFLKVTRPIEKDDELLVSYGKGYWNAEAHTAK